MSDVENLVDPRVVARNRHISVAMATHLLLAQGFSILEGVVETFTPPAPPPPTPRPALR